MRRPFVSSFLLTLIDDIKLYLKCVGECFRYQELTLIIDNIRTKLSWTVITQYQPV